MGRLNTRKALWLYAASAHVLSCAMRDIPQLKAHLACSTQPKDAAEINRNDRTGGTRRRSIPAALHTIQFKTNSTIGVLWLNAKSPTHKGLLLGPTSANLAWCTSRLLEDRCAGCLLLENDLLTSTSEGGLCYEQRRTRLTRQKALQ